MVNMKSPFFMVKFFLWVSYVSSWGYTKSSKSDHIFVLKNPEVTWDSPGSPGPRNVATCLVTSAGISQRRRSVMGIS